MTRYLDPKDKASQKSKRVKQSISLSPTGRKSFLPNYLRGWLGEKNEAQDKDGIGEYILNRISEIEGIPTEAFEDAIFSIMLNGRTRKISIRDMPVEE